MTPGPLAFADSERAALRIRLLLVVLRGRLAVDRALQASPALRSEAVALVDELERTRATPTAWRVPPPGLGLDVTATPVAVLDQQATRVRVELPADGRQVVVLQRQEGDWQVQTVLPPTTSVDLTT